ncbi:hypothetical protein [Fodinicola feengrottensis]|uniref:hypothetical protein n=1 Tax=Fodinicola feengrottensis TaxID=435914 RepID=UPI0013D5394F|nr:hypothetical protein [Fodinicola feengrottensis]
MAPGPVSGECRRSGRGRRENITNTKLEISGGLAIPAPTDGRPLFIAVYPTVRLTPAGRPVPASVATTLVMRPAR